MIRGSAQYTGYTLMEVLVVLMIVIILGGLGAYAFGGLRDSVLVKQSLEDIKQDLQLAQQKAMLLDRKDGEGWIYGIGIDFTNIENGEYKFFKWCSPFSAYGDIRTRSIIMAYDEVTNIGAPTAYGPNASLPDDINLDSSLCDRDTSVAASSYITSMPGMEAGKIRAGFNISRLNDSAYVVFEAVTGRVFLYNEVDGLPTNYDTDGTYNGDINFAIEILRNQGRITDRLSVYPLSGAVSHDIIEN